MQWNIQGKNNIQEFRNYIEANNIQPDVICLQETWANQKSTLPNIPNYAKPIFKNRTDKKGGGVAIYVKNNIPFKEIDLSSLNIKIEVCAIKIHLENKTIFLYNLYDNIFQNAENIEEYKLLFEQVDQNNSLIVGDFNAHNPLWDTKINNAKGQALLEVFNNHYFVVSNNGQPTLSVHDTTSDITLASPTISAISEWRVLQQTCGSDHLPILIKLNVRYNTTGSSGVPKWKLGKADWDKFKTLCSTKLKLNKNSETINEIASDFCKIFVKRRSRKPNLNVQKSNLHGGIKTVL